MGPNDVTTRKWGVGEHQILEWGLAVNAGEGAVIKLSFCKEAAPKMRLCEKKVHEGKMQGHSVQTVSTSTSCQEKKRASLVFKSTMQRNHSR